jgi:hypothetical protein
MLVDPAPGLDTVTIEVQLVVHAGGCGDVPWLFDSGVCLDREPVLNPNVLFVNNGSTVNSWD